MECEKGGVEGRLRGLLYVREKRKGELVRRRKMHGTCTCRVEGKGGTKRKRGERNWERERKKREEGGRKGGRRKEKEMKLGEREEREERREREREGGSE